MENVSFNVQSSRQRGRYTQSILDGQPSPMLFVPSTDQLLQVNNQPDNSLVFKPQLVDEIHEADLEHSLKTYMAAPQVVDSQLYT